DVLGLAQVVASAPLVTVVLGLLVGILCLTVAQGDEVAGTQAENTAEDPLLSRGQTIWQNSCASCHGEAGEGVAGAYEIPLVGDKTLGQLAEVIAATMPEGEPEECTGDDAA